MQILDWPKKVYPPSRIRKRNEKFKDKERRNEMERDREKRTDSVLKRDVNFRVSTTQRKGERKEEDG